MNIAKSTQEQGALARAERRFTQGVVLSVDPLLHTARVDVNYVAPNGLPQYLEDVPYITQTPPSPGDTVTLGYNNSSAHSVYITGGRLGSANAQTTINVVGGVSTVRLAAETLANATKGDIVLNNSAYLNWTHVAGVFTSSLALPLTTKGDLLGFSTVLGRLAVGADGLVLTADSTQPFGIRWGVGGGGGGAATTVTDVGASSIVGTLTSYAREDHQHKGVHKINNTVDASGDLVFSGSGVSQVGNTFTFSGTGTPASTVTEVGASNVVGTSANFAREDHQHRGVHKITGTSAVYGDIIVAGTGVVQSGNTFTIDSPKRKVAIALCEAFTPLATGADIAEVMIPGSTTWTCSKITLRVQTAGGAPAITIEKSTGTGVFSAVTVGTVTLGSGAYEGSLLSPAGTLASGDKLRFNVGTLATATGWTIIVELNEQ